MNRTEKKCIIVSTGFHLLLGLLLLVGPGFLAPSSKMSDAPVLTFIPYETTDKDISGGGDPKGGSPPPATVIAPPEPTPVVAPPAPVAKEEPKPEPVKPKPEPKEVSQPKDDSFSAETTKPKKQKREISTTLVKRDTSDVLAAAKARAEADARAAAEARSRAIGNLSKSLDRIGGSLSSSTSVGLLGPGGGGVPYANFLQGVKKIYSDAWIVPDGIKDDSATVTVSVTIGRDGTVISSRITRRSGEPAVDQSVQMTLDRVTRVVPLPKDSTDKERTVSINFNVKAKLLG